MQLKNLWLLTHFTKFTVVAGCQDVSLIVQSCFSHYCRSKLHISGECFDGWLQWTLMSGSSRPWNLVPYVLIWWFNFNKFGYSSFFQENLRAIFIYLFIFGWLCFLHICVCGSVWRAKYFISIFCRLGLIFLWLS